jgi:hypothetical protein
MHIASNPPMQMHFFTSLEVDFAPNGVAVEQHEVAEASNVVVVVHTLEHEGDVLYNAMIPAPHKLGQHNVN